MYHRLRNFLPVALKFSHLGSRYRSCELCESRKVVIKLLLHGYLVPGREGDGWGRQVAFRRFRLKMPRKSTEPSMLGDIKRVTGATAAKGKRRGGDTHSLRLSTGIVECINLREIFKVEFSASMIWETF